jgi:hypothetical protein
MTPADNYLAVLTSRETRVQHGLSQHESIFPFCSGDDLRVAEAGQAANRLQARLERLGIASTLVVYAPISELIGMPSILDVDEAREAKQRRVRGAMRKGPLRSSSLIGWKAGRIGASGA